jgi:hypothetical protein
MLKNRSILFNILNSHVVVINCTHKNDNIFPNKQFPPQGAGYSDFDWDRSYNSKLRGIRLIEIKKVRSNQMRWGTLLGCGFRWISYRSAKVWIRKAKRLCEGECEGLPSLSLFNFLLAGQTGPAAWQRSSPWGRYCISALLTNDILTFLCSSRQG